MKNKYNKTVTACFVGYIVQAIINNFVPLLFLTFKNTYQIPLSEITMLVTINFGIQLLVDLLSAGIADRIGYRTLMIIAHILSALGLVLLTILPEIISIPFIGILISVTIYAVGGGLLEVLVSPVVESCPSDNKAKAMSMLHSFYCWGHVGVVLISTLYFYIFGIDKWKILCVAWALIPLINAVVFKFVPIRALLGNNEKAIKIKDLLSLKLFWVLFIMMICSGASEQGVSQWASAYAEKELGVIKAVGDIAGPMMFAVMMGISRLFYGKAGERLNLNKFMIFSTVLCILAYLGISIIQNPIVSFVSCGLCGLSVGIMWPGTFSSASSALPKGGTALFAFLALGGDIGCSAGPTLVGLVSGIFDDNLKKGILAGIIFPCLLLIGIFVYNKLLKENK